MAVCELADAQQLLDEDDRRTGRFQLENTSQPSILSHPRDARELREIARDTGTSDMLAFTLDVGAAPTDWRAFVDAMGTALESVRVRNVDSAGEPVALDSSQGVVDIEAVMEAIDCEAIFDPAEYNQEAMQVAASFNTD